LGEIQAGRPVCAMGFKPGLFVRPPLRLAWIVPRATYRSVSLSPWFSRVTSTVVVEVRMALARWVGRAIGLDVHRWSSPVVVDT
jgi:hypothetical protein